ncbi:MAG: hypothetical protein JRJ19_12530 [Deltaproteobacteria bacterium]|nr:hypothetical protein [Deltaproteobacteria bacterium]MBW1872888.1 hypothetical protein [Deltaproteobacteria bacterium]
MRASKILSIILLAGLGLLFGSCSGGSGVIDCAAYVDRMIECEIIPPENADQLREPNILICNNWEKTYKETVMEALDACTVVPCEENQQCVYTANQLCQADVSAEIEQMCEKVSECGWEELTTMELCREALQRNQGLYMCLKPEILANYIACVRAVTCGPDGEDDWYACYGAHIVG